MCLPYVCVRRACALLGKTRAVGPLVPGMQDTRVENSVGAKKKKEKGKKLLVT